MFYFPALNDNNITGPIYKQECYYAVYVKIL